MNNYWFKIDISMWSCMEGYTMYIHVYSVLDILTMIHDFCFSTTADYYLYVDEIIIILSVKEVYTLDYKLM